jgi:hypothetical protein
MMAWVTDFSLAKRLGPGTTRLRVLTALAVLLFVFVFVRYAWATLAAYNQRLDETIEMRTLELQRFSRILAEGDAYQGVHAELARFQEDLTAARFVKAATPPLSEAMFQHIVNEWADKMQVNILSLRVLPRVEREGFSVMRLAVNTRGEIAAIQNFLVAVRQSPRFIFFEEVEIKTISRNERRFFYFNAQLAAWTMI